MLSISAAATNVTSAKSHGMSRYVAIIWIIRFSSKEACVGSGFHVNQGNKRACVYQKGWGKR